MCDQNQITFPVVAPPAGYKVLFADTNRGADTRLIISQTVAVESRRMLPMIFDDYRWIVKLEKENDTLRFVMRPVREGTK